MNYLKLIVDNRKIHEITIKYSGIPTKHRLPTASQIMVEQVESSKKYRPNDGQAAVKLISNYNQTAVKF
jgi:hypothetical protein